MSLSQQKNSWQVGPATRLAISFLIPAALASLAGCGFVNPRYEVGDKKILLVPFRDFTRQFGTGFGESPNGHAVIDAFRSWSETNASPRFAEGQDADQAIRTLQEWTKPKITPSDWHKILGGTDADLVLIGEIREIRAKDPNTVGMYKGLIRGNYTLIDGRTGRPAYRSTELNVEYPKLTELDLPIPEFSTKPETIKKGLLREFGAKIGKDLYGYYKDQ